MGRGKRKRTRSGFFDTEVIGVISEWMWALIIFTLLALLVAALY